MIKKANLDFWAQNKFSYAFTRAYACEVCGQLSFLTKKIQKSENFSKKISTFWGCQTPCIMRAGCAIGGGIVWGFGPMLIVFGMFAIGTLSVVLHEVARIRKEAVNNKT